MSMLLICFSVYSNGQAKVTSQNLKITSENAHQVRLLATLPLPLHHVTGIRYRFSPDSSLLITYQNDESDQVIRVWNTATLALQNELHLDPNEWIEDAVMSPDNHQLLLFSTVAIFGFQWWDLVNNKQIAAVAQSYNDARFSSDSRYIAVLYKTSLQLLDSSNGQLLKSFNLSSPSDSTFGRITFSSDGRYIAASTNKAVLIWNIETDELVATLEGLRNPNYVSFSSDNTHLIAANIVAGYGYFSKVGAWDLSNTAKGHIFTSKIAHASKNGRIALIQNDDTTDIIDLMTGETNARVQEKACYSLGNWSKDSLSPDGRTMASCDASGFKFIDTATGTTRAKTSITGEFYPWILTFSPDSKLVVTVVPFDGSSMAYCRLQLWDVQTGEEVLNTPSPCQDITFSSDGSTIASLSFSGASVLILGIPDNNREAYVSVPAVIIPSVIAVRAKPSIDAEVTGYISGEIVISGIDPSGRFYYMGSNGGGWISAATGYVDLGGFSSKDQIHVRES